MRGARRVVFDFPLRDRERAYDCIDAMRPVAAAHGGSLARVALAWLLAQLHVTTLIVGAKKEAQLVDNLAATRLTLDDLLRHLRQRRAEQGGGAR